MFGLRAAGGLGLRRYATATATAATPRGPPSLIHPPPATISYFTGNPAYYDQLLVLNGFLRNVRQHMASLSKTLSAERFAAAEAAASTASSSAISDDWMDDASKPKLPEIPIVSQDTKLADLPLMSAFSSASTTNATQQQQQMQSPKWMSPDELLAFRSIRVSVNEYAELIKKLDILHSSKDLFAQDAHQADQVSAFLTFFMVPFAKSARVTLDPPSLDQYGRSLTFASRKTARAQVYMIPNSQALIYVNGRPLESYFTTASERDAVLQGLYPENGLEKWNIWCVVKGGGLAAQAQALKVAIARGRVVHEPEMEETLAEMNLLRIDTRQVERKKTGQPKARKKNTWVKR